MTSRSTAACLSIYVTITRNPSPLWSGGERITESEWREAALAEGDFRPPTEAELREEAPSAWPDDLVWTGHPRHPAVWFSWDDGQVDVKYLGEVTIAKMMKLAGRLRARVISEQGELFDADGRSLGLHDLPDEPGTRKPSLLSRLFGRRRGGV
jgi:hypothetical protein